MATVTFDHVSKRFSGDVLAVNDLSLQIADGEFLVLVGPSGCGKTTALRCVAGLESISDGKLLIGDRVVNDVAPKDRDIAMVFQSYALYPHMSVYENLAFGLQLRKMAKADIDARVREAAGILGLETYLDRKPKALSGGQRQRVALGRAIVREPKAFLMDEPLSNLDAKLRVQTRAEIARIHRRLGTTIVYVTHDQVEAMTMGDRIALMKDGILHQAGTPEELYKHPANLFVAGFIGSPAMNFVAVTAAGEELMMGQSKLTLAGEAAKAAANRPAGTSLTIGFRPEHLEVASEAGGQAITFSATVDVVEYLGNDELIHLRAEGNEIVALLSSDRKVQVGEQIPLAVPLEHLYLFDSDTEQSLLN